MADSAMRETCWSSAETEHVRPAVGEMEQIGCSETRLDSRGMSVGKRPAIANSRMCESRVDLPSSRRSRTSTGGLSLAVTFTPGPYIKGISESVVIAISADTRDARDGVSVTNRAPSDVENKWHRSLTDDSEMPIDEHWNSCADRRRARSRKERTLASSKRLKSRTLCDCEASTSLRSTRKLSRSFRVAHGPYWAPTSDVSPRLHRRRLRGL
eukprot:7384401-Prymnesium_polylepis.2